MKQACLKDESVAVLLMACSGVHVEHSCAGTQVKDKTPGFPKIEHQQHKIR